MRNPLPLLFSPSVWDSSNAQPVIPMFELQAEPVGNNTASPSATLNLLFTNGLEQYPTETGLSINQSGVITFAPGQTFPGTETTGSGGISGTAGYVPLFTATSALGNSPIAVSNGNVGIGTTSPGTTLQVVGTAQVIGTSYFGQNSNGTAVIDAYGGDAFFGANLATNGIAVNGSGQVGIGTASPTEILDVSGNSVIGAGTERLSLGPGSIGFNRRVDTGQIYYSSAYAYQFQHTESTSPGSDYLALQVYTPTGDHVTTDALVVNGSGNVGIGTITPGAKLEVDGSIKLTANSGASITFQDSTVQSTAWTGALVGGDYAESVDLSGDRTKYEPGDLLAVDKHSPSNFVKSSEPYSTMVAGIYSTKPGVLGRRQTATKDADEAPMAVVGIVPAKVCAENGAIEAGDLLVSSSTPGVAMKGTDRNRMLGAVVGKAMGTLNADRGVIEVLVTLQ